MKFSRQEYWSEFPFPSPEDLPDAGIEPTSLSSLALAGRFFNTSNAYGNRLLFLNIGKAGGKEG